MRGATLNLTTARYADDVSYHTFYFLEKEKEGYAKALSFSITAYEHDPEIVDGHQPADGDEPNELVPERLAEIENHMARLAEGVGRYLKPLNIIIGLLVFDLALRIFR
jgi:hypothetical protein